MPSKKSKPIPKVQQPSPRAEALQVNPPSVWKAEPACSEAILERLAGELAHELRVGDRVLLEGPMGAGKTTFSRLLLLALGVEQPPEGSPTFAIAHEYMRGAESVVHMDLYRIRSEAEIDERGIPDYFWDPRKIVLCEWLSMWSEFERAVLRAGRNWRVELDFFDEELRSIRITQPS